MNAVPRTRRGLLTISASALALGTVVAVPAAGAATAAGPAAGTISTAAGGPGGPGKATKVALGPCNVDVSGGSLYIAARAAVRRVTANDQLTTPAGTGET